MKVVFDLKPYISGDSFNSCYSGIPIEYLDITKKILKSRGFRFVIKYRGPRNNIGDNRSRYNKQSNCLKKYATHFAVYSRVQFYIVPDKGKFNIHTYLYGDCSSYKFLETVDSKEIADERIASFLKI